MSNPFFSLINFTPVGFKEPCYPVQYCCLCRGKLNDVCSTCLENLNQYVNCNVLKVEDNYYHSHCYIILRTTESKPVNQAQVVSSDSEDIDSD